MKNLLFLFLALAIGCKKDSINVTANADEFWAVHNEIKGHWYEKSGVRVKVTDSTVTWTHDEDRPELPEVKFSISSAEGSGNGSESVSVARYYGKGEKLNVYVYENSVSMDVSIDGVGLSFATFPK